MLLFSLQALFELGASAEAIDLFKSVFGVAIGDTGMGLCGVTSSILILYEATINAMRLQAAVKPSATT